MRVLMMTHNMAGLGGSFMRAHSLAKSLVVLGNHVTLIASRRLPGRHRIEEEIDGVRVIQMADLLPERVRHGGLSPLDLAGRVKHADGPYDIIHGFDHRPSVSIPALLMRQRRQIPYVADWADLWGRGGIAEQSDSVIRRLLGWADHHWERFAHAHADAVTVVTRNLAGRAEQLGIPVRRIRLIQVGANGDVITPLSKTDMRIKHGLPEDAPIAVHNGFAPYDARLLADTFAILAKRNPRVILLLTGCRLPYLHELAEAAGFSDRVRHLGVVPYSRLGEILACGDVMLLPFSDRSVNAARYPNRVGDYLAAGRPIATNPTGDLGEMVRSEGIGIVPEAEPEAFAAAIDQLLANKESQQQMGLRARKLAETRLSWSALAKQLDELYRDLLSERGV